LNPELKVELDRENRVTQAELRARHAAGARAQPILPLAEARRRALRTDWEKAEIAQPGLTGLITLDKFSLEKLVPYIDWTPFFHAWELRGRYPQILKDETVGERARELLEDARRLLDRIVEERLLTARAVYGFFPANAVGDDIEVYADESRSSVLTVFHTL